MSAPFWEDEHLTLYGGDCRAVLAELPAESVHCVVTSPPYWGLRDYGTATWDGGDPECDHRKVPDPIAAVATSTLGGGKKTTGHQQEGFTGTCARCGARRIDSQLGLEPTPEEYVANMVGVFREVRRVLRADGTLWLNLGDSYASGEIGRHDGYNPTRAGGTGTRKPFGERRQGRPDTGLKPKDLVGIPWMVARALQAPYYTGKIRDERDRAWLAGWLDGEGTITFVERDRGEDHTPTHDARVYVTNTDRGPLDYFAAISGGRVNVHDDGTRENRYGSRVCYRWQTGTHDGALLLRELYPYLRTKRRQAALIWTLYTTLRHQNGHARTPESVVARRREIAEMVRSLNAGGDVTLPSWVEEPPSPTEPGWYLRSDIIWAKPNPMPESVTDRPTKAHEYLFLLAKSPRYYFDAEAVREADSGLDAGNGFAGRQGGARQTAVDGGEGTRERWRASKKPDGWATHDGREAGEAAEIRGGRNLRSVWNIATEPYPGAHFATFPRKLVEPCVKAGTSERGVCPECGAPWVRVVEPPPPPTPVVARTAKARAREAGTGEYPPNSTETGGVAGIVRLSTTGWSPSCRHDAEPVPAAVLDPFAGSGTTLLVAQSLGRRGVGIDLNPEYLQQALVRNAQTPLGLVG